MLNPEVRAHSFAWAFAIALGCQRTGSTPEPRTSSDPRAPAASQPRIAGTASASAPPKSRASVVWTRHKTDSPTPNADTSHFLDANANPLKTVPGIYVAIEDRLFRVSTVTREGPALTCADGRANPAYPERSLARTTLEPVVAGSATSIEIAGFASARNPADLPDRQSHTLLAAIENHLFVRSDDESGCGAHPSYVTSFHVWQIRRGKVIEIPLKEVVGGASELREHAKREFDRRAREYAQDGAYDEPAELAEIGPTLGLPSWSPQGLTWTVQLTAPATWVTTYGGWSGYTRSVMLRARQVPARFRAFAALGPVAAKVASAHAEQEVFGVSTGVVAVPN